MRFAHECTFCAVCARQTTDYIMSAIAECQHGCIVAHKLLYDRKSRKCRTGKPMHPDDHSLRLFRLARLHIGPEPKAVQKKFLRRDYLDDVCGSHMYHV